MKRSLQAIIDDEQKRGETRMTRLLKPDDNIIRKRKEDGSSYSLVIADLVHKGLLYESLERGAGDPVLRNLLRTIDSLISHRVHEATQPLLSAIEQNQKFTAALFLTLTAGLTLPLQDADKEQLSELRDACTGHANEMLDLILSPTHTPEVAKPPS